MRAARQSLPRNKFTKGEDRKLKECVKRFGRGNWKQISTFMPRRNARQCKDRWEKYLNPDVDNSPFSVDDDIKILKFYSVFGGKWKELSKMMPGRTDTSIKSRYKLLVRHGETLELLENMKKGDKVQEHLIDDEKSPDEIKDIDVSESAKIFSTLGDVYSEMNFL